MAIAQIHVTINVQKLITNMVEHAYENWETFVTDGIIDIDMGSELERAYEAVYDEILPDGVFMSLCHDPRINRAVDEMERIVKEQMEDAHENYLYHHGTPEQQLRARGMSRYDFI